jgi:electron transfer flavoprotein alpha subunit
MTDGSVAVLPVRDGTLPAGSLDAVAAAGGEVLIVGAGAGRAAELLGSLAVRVRVWDTPGFAPGRWAPVVADLVGAGRVVVLPGSPDGRDLAPRVAASLGRPLVAGVVEVRADRLVAARWGGSVMVEVALSGPVVVTVQPGLAAPESHEHGTGPMAEVVEAVPAGHRDAEVVELLGPDVATMDLAEAPRLVGGGAGLDSPERFGELAELAELIGAAMGATRVVTDRGWIGHERQIGTTGVVVDPSLYLAFGISGAVQHTAGLGDPDHIVSVNTEPHCPMMSMADLAIVSDANETVVELLRLLRSEGTAAS